MIWIHTGTVKQILVNGIGIGLGRGGSKIEATCTIPCVLEFWFFEKVAITIYRMLSSIPFFFFKKEI